MIQMYNNLLCSVYNKTELEYDKPSIKYAICIFVQSSTHCLIYHWTQLKGVSCFAWRYAKKADWNRC